MSPKSWVLIGAAIAVFAAGVYLFVQVKSATSAPAPTSVTTGTVARPSPTPERSTEPTGGPPQPTPAPTATTTTAPGGAQRQAVRVGNDVVQPQAMHVPDETERANPKLDSIMELANKAYDRQDFDEAIAVASKVLTKDPMNVRMLRVVVSSHCIQGDTAAAQSYYERLPQFDREQMKARCDRYQVTLKDP